MKSILKKIEKLYSIVKNSSNGHLPLKERVELLNSINPISEHLVTKVFFECLKKVYPIWTAEYPKNNILKNIILDVDDYLYRDSNIKSVFDKYSNEYVNYFQQEEGVTGLAGMTGWSLCQIISSDEAITVDNYKGEDDNYFDVEDWNPDFVASMAYSGGNPFVNEGSVDKRKEFWNWYLECIQKLVNNPNQPAIVLNLQTDTSETNTPQYNRKQSFKDESIDEKIKKIVDMSIEDLTNQEGGMNWSKIEVDSCCIRAGISIETNYFDSNNNKSSVENVRDWPDEEPVDFFDEIKEEMYNSFPQEGAWLDCKMIIHPDRSFKVFFNYDDFDTFSSRAKNPENLTREFEAYPRSKSFTPEWWQNLLGKKAKYLKDI